MRTNNPVLRRDTSLRQSRIEHFRRCLRSFGDAGSDGECLEGRCPRREPRTTWRAKPLFDRRLEWVDEASRAIRYVKGTIHDSWVFWVHPEVITMLETEAFVPPYAASMQQIASYREIDEVLRSPKFRQGSHQHTQMFMGG